MNAKKIVEILLLITVPLIGFGLLGELALRVYLSRNIFYDMEMSRYALTLKSDSPNPLIGHHHKPNSEAHLMGVDLRINGDGFRDDDYPVEKREKRRIMFLGDSLTLGWGVEKEDTFEHHLEQALDTLSPSEVINLGTGNYNTTQEVNLFLDKGLKYQPDQVVLFYFINDAEPVPQKSKYPGLGRSRLITFYWSRIKAAKARISPDAADFKEYYSALYRDGAAGWKGSQAAFLQLKRTCEREGIELEVVLLPELHQLDPYTFTNEYAQVMRFLKANSIAAIDLTPRFKNEPNPQTLWVSMDDAHPNARAHALIAKYTLDFIKGHDIKGQDIPDEEGRGDSAGSEAPIANELTTEPTVRAH
jgi:lysophospholipase L1-like esterase